MSLPHSTRPVAVWLFICVGAVFLMALIGAVTRLTESGLSITEWKPIEGIFPPLDAAAWQKEFDLYRESPQYKKVNMGMDLADFKKIYFWEWVHRFWGRIIGLIYAVPLIFLWERIPQAAKPALLGVLALGFAQGAMGWIMVKSGLVNHPAVSHYRLAAHLMLAFMIYACLLRLALAFSLAPEKDAAKMTEMRGMIKSTLALAALTMTWGAFTAGLDAGMLYNTFPAMDGHWFPPETLQYHSLWRAFLDEPATVQFMHRVLALLTLLKVLLLVRKAGDFHSPQRLARLFKGLALIVFLQVSLGVATLLTQVNIVLAVAHQAGALLLLSLLVWLLHEIPAIVKVK